jgi:hypothetical protein
VIPPPAARESPLNWCAAICTTRATGRVAAEMFKDATGNPHRAYFDSKDWHAYYYRIVRLW